MPCIHAQSQASLLTRADLRKYYCPVPAAGLAFDRPTRRSMYPVSLALSERSCLPPSLSLSLPPACILHTAALPKVVAHSPGFPRTTGRHAHSAPAHTWRRMRSAFDSFFLPIAVSLSRSLSLHVPTIPVTSRHGPVGLKAACTQGGKRGTGCEAAWV